MISTFELFTPGIGPSSSHTVGPMRAAKSFLKHCENDLTDIHQIQVTVFGSLAFTGYGHGTDKALMMGLEGEQPESVDPCSINDRMQQIGKSNEIRLLGKHVIAFNPLTDLIFNHQEQFDFHPNAMRFTATNKHHEIIHQAVYFSIGGGFIVEEGQTEAPDANIDWPYPFESAAELFSQCEENQLSVGDLMLTNESHLQPTEEVKRKLINIANIMQACIEKGCNTCGTLPGKLNVQRRANSLYLKLIAEGQPGPKHPQVMNWLNVFAMAVNEENAAGGRIVTAPTNGAAGIIPAALQYYKLFCPNPTENGVIQFLLTASAIGVLYKKNASISGAEMGCQGEVGVACSMAAAGLTAALNGSLHQIENAAEIGMEHNLGLTCDPVHGLVQIPCIERNAMASVKAVNAAMLALAETGKNIVTLDMVIDTMREIGEKMDSDYKETSLGGLAVTVRHTEC